MAPTYSRKNLANSANIDLDHLYAQGTFKNVYLGVYTSGERKGQVCVAKRFKSGSVFENSYFANELITLRKSLEIIDRFNNREYVSCKIWLNLASVWNCSHCSEKFLHEPFLKNFEKFNSNTGWTRENNGWSDVLQALSHFSYHISDGQYLLCDLQGAIYKEGMILTDPVIMSEKKDFGPSDLGLDGISSFFAHHTCSKYCRPYWLLPTQRTPVFKKTMGTTMNLPNIDSSYN